MSCLVAKRVVNTKQIFKGKELEVKRLGTEASKKVEESGNENGETKMISVSGLPEGSTETSVHIHFQKKKNCGGDIEKVELLGQGKALVVFEDPRGMLDHKLPLISKRYGCTFSP